jgi:hypothetical protein
MATTTAPHYLLAYVEEGGGVRNHRALGPAPGPTPSHWAVRVARFWPANRPGEPNNPWHRESAVGRDRGALCLRVGPLLRGAHDLDATAIRIFDVSVGDAVRDCFPSILLDHLLPAKVRAGDGLIIQADLVDVSLFTSLDQVMEEAGKIIDRKQRAASEVSVGFSDTMTLFSDVAGAVLSALWRGILHPIGVDARAWDPHQAQFYLHGPSLDRPPQARPGTYLLAGFWSSLRLEELRYDPVAGLCACGDPSRRIAANILEFELMALRG